MTVTTQDEKKKPGTLLKRILVGVVVVLVLVFLAYGVPAQIASANRWLNEWARSAPFWSGLLPSAVVTLVIIVVARYEWATTVAEWEPLIRINHKLAEGLAGPFTKSVLSYHPASSPLLVTVLSSQVDEVYRRHWARPAVESASDAYRLIRQDEGEENGGPHWVVSFTSSWTWRNDSQVEKFPLKDFVLGTAPTVGALQGCPARNGQAKPLELFQNALNSYPNFYIVNIDTLSPETATKEIVTKAIELEHLWIKRVDGSTDVVKIVECEEIYGYKDSEAGEKYYEGLSNGFYFLARLPERIRDLELLRGDALTVGVKGQMRLRRQESEEGHKGKIRFQPSDIVANEGRYEMAFLVSSRDAGEVVMRHHSAFGRETQEVKAVARPNALSADIQSRLEEPGDEVYILTSRFPVVEQDLMEIEWATAPTES